MSHWSHHPEDLNAAILENLPAGWAMKICDGEVGFSDVPEGILFRAMKEGAKEYWADWTDRASLRTRGKKNDI